MKNLIYLWLIVGLISCNKSSKLQTSFNCKSNNLSVFNTIKDFNRNFSINIPTIWKTNLYYTKNDSEIYAADTVKQLSKTFILGALYHQETIELNTSYLSKLDSVLFVNKLQKINSGNELFLGKPTYWYLVKGRKNGFPYHQFSMTIKISKNSFLNATSEIYGDQLVNERICESISIFKSLKFLE